MPDNLRVINFEGPVSIGTIQSWKQLLATALDGGHDCILNFSRASDADLTIIQLVVSAKMHAKELGLGCQIGTQASASFLETAWLCGILRTPSMPAGGLDKAFDNYLGPVV